MAGAAGELNIIQTALSEAIKRLESEVGVPQFDRQRRGIRLNGIGVAFRAHVERVFRALETATDEIPDLAGLEQGVVSLAAGAFHWLPDVLRPFKADHPEVRCHRFRRSLAELCRLLETGAIDCCFVPAATVAPTLGWRHLHTDEVSLVVPSRHRLAGRPAVALRDVSQDEMVLGGPGDVLREIMDGYFRRAGFVPRVACEADEPAAVEDFVAPVFGVALIPGLPKPHPSHDVTSWIRITEPRCLLTVGIAGNESRYLSRTARAFREHVIAFVAARSAAIAAA